MHFHLPKPLHGWREFAGEVGIIVLGILIALSAEQLVESIHQRSERETATQRLFYEAQDDVAYFRAQVESHTLAVQDLSYALEQLQKGTWPEADEKRMTTGLTHSVYLDVPSPPSSVYEDIVAAGMLGKIGDPQLRSAISGYRAKLELLGTLINYVRQVAPRLDREDSLRYVYNADGPRPARLEVDFAALAGDRKAQSSLALLNDRQWFILQNRVAVFHAAEAMCRELGRRLKRPCESSPSRP